MYVCPKEPLQRDLQSKQTQTPDCVWTLAEVFLLKRSCVLAKISIVVLLITRALLPLHRLTLDVMHSKRNNAARNGRNGCKVTTPLII